MAERQFTSDYCGPNEEFTVSEDIDLACAQDPWCEDLDGDGVPDNNTAHVDSASAPGVAFHAGVLDPTTDKVQVLGGLTGCNAGSARCADWDDIDALDLTTDAALHLVGREGAPEVSFGGTSSSSKVALPASASWPSKATRGRWGMATAPIGWDFDPDTLEWTVDSSYPLGILGGGTSYQINSPRTQYIIGPCTNQGDGCLWCDDYEELEVDVSSPTVGSYDDGISTDDKALLTWDGSSAAEITGLDALSEAYGLPLLEVYHAGAAWAGSGRALIVGGVNGTTLDTIVEVDLTGADGTIEETDITGMLGARKAPSMVTDPISGSTYLVGGDTADDTLYELHTPLEGLAAGWIEATEMSVEVRAADDGTGTGGISWGVEAVIEGRVVCPPGLPCAANEVLVSLNDDSQTAQDSAVINVELPSGASFEPVAVTDWITGNGRSWASLRLPHPLAEDESLFVQVSYDPEMVQDVTYTPNSSFEPGLTHIGSFSSDGDAWVYSGAPAVLAAFADLDADGTADPIDADADGIFDLNNSVQDATWADQALPITAKVLVPSEDGASSQPMVAHCHGQPKP